MAKCRTRRNSSPSRGDPTAHQGPRCIVTDLEDKAAVRFLRSLEAVRERSENIYAAGLRGELRHFRVNESALDAVAEEVVAVTRESYPDLRVPYHSRWNHFRAGGIDRVAELDQHLAELEPTERARVHVDLVVTSVLLDAGAGDAWRFMDRDANAYARSEGLAVASLRMFEAGAFSADPARPFRADADALHAVDEHVLARGFQVREDNPLVGLRGRAALLSKLGGAVRRAPHVFGAVDPRVGNLVDHLLEHLEGDALPATQIFRHVVTWFAPIWPGRLELAGENLGDVWLHPHAGGSGRSAGLVPFHKLSQWLTYSMLEPFEWLGVRVTGIGALTGLPEYRNGGLFVDLGALEPMHADVLGVAHRPGAEVIVEWRALTVALLDRTAERVRARLGKTAEEMPLANVLEGGTWAAGRRVAARLRPGGPPPIRIESDGTVF
ncbi:MAG: URC4/urg3 family protein [Myxococcales bacterium]|nr:URC4/urg3 family protein [Myxococcales bacterium]